MVKKLALGLLVLVALYVGAALAMALRATEREQQVASDAARLAALGDAAQLEAGPTTGLAEACGQLERVSRTELLAYYTAPPEGVLTDDVARQGYEAPLLLGLNEDRFELGSTALPMQPRGLFPWLMEFLGDLPPYWGMYASQAFDPFSHTISGTRYLVVHQLQSLQLPMTSGHSYWPGHMTFLSAVLDARTGQVLCQGATAIEQNGDIPVAASGATAADAQRALEERADEQVRSLFFIDLRFFALRDVCWLADESICKLTFGTFRPAA